MFFEEKDKKNESSEEFMKQFFTSNPFKADGSINEENDFLWNIKYSLPYETNALLVSSSYKDSLTNDRLATNIKDAFNSKGIFFKSMDVLDYRTASMSKEEIAAHNFIIIAGGHAPTQNDFIRITGLKDKLEGYDGTIMGIGVGSMNAAEEVYMLPEHDGEAADNSFERFRTGLGLTKLQIVPHYDQTVNSSVDGFPIRERMIYDSKDKKFLGLPDGSYVMSTDGVELIYGTHYKIENRAVTKIEASFMAKSFE